MKSIRQSWQASEGCIGPLLRVGRHYDVVILGLRVGISCGACCSDVVDGVASTRAMRYAAMKGAPCDQLQHDVNIINLPRSPSSSGP